MRAAFLPSFTPPPLTPFYAASSAKKAPAASSAKKAPASSAKKVAAGPTDAQYTEIVGELVTLLKENPGHVLLLVPEEAFAEAEKPAKKAKAAAGKKAPAAKKAVAAKKPAKKAAAKAARK